MSSKQPISRFYLTKLYDQTNEFCSSDLIFGRSSSMVCRMKELTKLLEISTQIEQITPSSRNGTEAVFVSGVAGSGKSHFVESVVGFLTNSGPVQPSGRSQPQRGGVAGWMVLKVKFKRTMEHASRDIVLSLFEELIANLVRTKQSTDQSDIDYSRQATNAISDAFSYDPASLSFLATFIPTIQDLIPGIGRNASQLAEADMSLWQLVFLLSKLVGAILR